MTDLLSRSPIRRPSTDEGGGRPLAASAALAGLAAPVVVLLTLWAVGLVGWYAADGGSHGTTRSVLRVAADAWLLAHGAHLTTGPVTVTASPLGLTVLCLVVTYRCGRKAGVASSTSDLPTVGLGVVVLAGLYGVVALLTSLLASAPGVEPGPSLALLGGALVGVTAGGAGLLRGTGRAAELRRRVPVPALSVCYGALAVVGSMVAAGSFLTALSLAVHREAAARVAQELALDPNGALFSLLLLLAILPNVALLAASYLLGPGFAVGVGSVVSPAEVVLGPVPSIPVLAALPADGWSPDWVSGLLAVPVLAGAASAFAAGLALPVGSFRSGAARGLGAGLLGGLLLAVAISHAGGAIGPGRMSQVGAGFGESLLAAVAAIGLGGALGGLAGSWWTRRRGLPDAEHPERPTTASSVRTVPVPPGPVGPADLYTEETAQLRLPPAR